MRGTRRFVISLVLVLLVTGGLVGATFAFGLEPRLGLDLQGGLAVTLTAPADTRTDVLDKTVDVLRRRVDAAGVAEPEITREGADNILVQLPGTGTEAQTLLDLLGRTAQLQFRQLQGEIPPTDPNYPTVTVSEEDVADQTVVLLDENGVKYQLLPAELTGAAISRALARINPQGGWEIQVRFNREGSRQWTEFTGRLACVPAGDPTRRVAIVLDAIVESSPQVGEEVQCNEGISGGETVITGSFGEQEAKDLALVLNTGALPVKLEQSEVRIVSPTLGRDALRAGLLAGALGMGLVLIYVVAYYRVLGLQVWFGLAVFATIIYGLILVFGELIHWSLTLAGIAGLIVAVGIATDSYIVFFERVKEETHSGRTLRSSVDRGFGHAWRTLRTANFVTILAAITLYFLAVGPVRGFALALGIATTLDLLVTYSLTWPVAGLLSRSRVLGEGKIIGMRRALEGKAGKGEKRSLLQKIYRSEFNINFMGRRKWFALISGVLLLVSALSLVPAVRGLRFGIDFKGGTIFRVDVPENVTVPEVRDAMTDVGQTDAVVQILEDRASGETQIQVQTGAFESAAERTEVVEALADVTEARRADVNIEAVGEKWGQQITTRALRGLIIFLVLAILYMAWRLELKMSTAGIIALFHDLIITAGIYALVGFEVSPATVIATLTILGYSLYDTVVVFDKIRENVELPSNARKSYTQIANESTNQVLMRSINTSLTTLIPVGSLLLVGSFLLGAETLKDLALALFVGIAAGAYSSIFVAAPLLSVWKEREPRYTSVREKVMRAQRAEEAPPLEEEGEPVAVTATSGAAVTAATARLRTRKQPRAKRKKGRR